MGINWVCNPSAMGIRVVLLYKQDKERGQDVQIQVRRITAMERLDTVCRKCGKVSEVRGITVADLEDAIEGFEWDGQAIPVTCAPCRFRMAQADREQTPAQKAARREYNRTRNARQAAIMHEYYRANPDEAPKGYWDRHGR